MKTNEITRIAFLSSVLVLVYYAFSQILYLELLTTTILLYSLNLKRREAFLIPLIFSSVIIMSYGIQSFTIMYAIIFPVFGIISYFLRNLLLKSHWFLVIYGGLFSFLLGTLVDLPHILLSGKATMVYIIMGLKTGLIQGFLTSNILVLVFEELNKKFKMIVKGI